MEAVLQPEVAIAGAADKFDAEGNLTDAKAKELISQLLKNLVAKAR